MGQWTQGIRHTDSGTQGVRKTKTKRPKDQPEQETQERRDPATQKNKTPEGIRDERLRYADPGPGDSGTQGERRPRDPKTQRPRTQGRKTERIRDPETRDPGP